MPSEIVKVSFQLNGLGIPDQRAPALIYSKEHAPPIGTIGVDIREGPLERAFGAGDRKQVQVIGPKWREAIGPGRVKAYFRADWNGSEWRLRELVPDQDW